jgi:sialic acid synthase SpsE
MNSHKIEVIAEIGISHNGDLDMAKKLIQKAKEAGADVAKFQLYDPKKRPDINAHPWKDVLLQSVVTRRFLRELKASCDYWQIEFMASVFDLDRINWCEEIGMSRYKIASKSLYDDRLTSKIISLGKPVIASLGMFNLDKGLPEVFLRGSVSLLHCVTVFSKAAPLDAIRLFDVADHYEGVLFPYFGKRLSRTKVVGFSDHTPGINFSIAAMALGATIIEKHFTLDNDLPGPDHLFSLLPGELAALCEARNEMQILWNNALRKVV